VRLLLDTHVFLWWCADDPQLTERERSAIRSAANDVFLSAVSVWEMTIKQGLGRLEIPEPASAAAARLGIQALPVTFEHAEATLELPTLHRDPFDRLLVAQASTEGLTLLTHDPQIRAYPGVRFLPA
jgi:PIN domain nuclease of toxin-antitoxin system